MRYRFGRTAEFSEVSATPPLSIAFVMDPIASIDIRADTTFVLMLEAQRRGHRVLYVDPGDLGVDAGRVTARVRPRHIAARAGPPRRSRRARTCSSLDDDVDLVLQRKDPPVDSAYVIATQILSLCRRALVLNRPAGHPRREREALRAALRRS